MYNNNTPLCKPSVSYHVSEHGKRLTACCCIVCVCVCVCSVHARVLVCKYMYHHPVYCLMSVGSGQPWQMIFYHGQSLYSPKRPWSYFSIGFRVIISLRARMRFNRTVFSQFNFFFARACITPTKDSHTRVRPPLQCIMHVGYVWPLSAAAARNKI